MTPHDMIAALERAKAATKSLRRLADSGDAGRMVDDDVAELEAVLPGVLTALRASSPPAEPMPAIQVGDVIQAAATWWDSVDAIEADGAPNLRGWRVEPRNVLAIYRDPLWRRPSPPSAETV